MELRSGLRLSNDTDKDKNYTTYIGTIDKTVEIKISFMCRESWPCGHDVIINGKKGGMNGCSIYELLDKHKIPIPDHFSQYTAEGMKKSNDEHDRMWEMFEEQERLEQNKKEQKRK